ncbi:MAG: TonB-dependent receptor [Bacteroidales bacterium]|nr:TonB-dependent receptor [Bacteroidales bacterium]
MKISKLAKLILVVVIMFTTGWVQAAAQTITGKVTDQDGKALPGVSVYLKGTTTGVFTDANGAYSINNRTGSKVLVFSCIGMKEREEIVGGRKVINVNLEEDMNLLDETVVIGYQQVQRRDLMGAVASADSKAVSSVPSTNFTSSLTGKMAGVNVTTTEGDPDAPVQIRIRGTGSITQDAVPLYIVDGFPVSSISDIAANDIKSVDVLKDAFSTAIYGSRGAYGVVLITTRDGARGKVSVKYDGYVGLKTMANPNNYELMNPYEFAMSVYEGSILDNSTGRYTSRFGRFEDMYLYKTFEGNDWRKRVFGRLGTTMNHYVSVSGSTDKNRWQANFGRMDEDAVMIYSSYSRTNFRFTNWCRPVKNFDFNVSLRYSNTAIHGAGANSINDKGTNAGTGRLISTLRYSPIPMNYLRDVEDYDYYSQEYGTNPIQNVKDNDNERNRENWNANASVTWTIIPNLKLKVEGGVDNWDEKNDRFYGRTSYFTREKSNVPGYPNTDSSHSFSRNYRNVNTLSYKFDRVFKKGSKHRLDMLLGQEYQYKKVNTETVVAEGFPDYYDASMARRYRGTAQMISSANNFYNENEVMLSFFGRFNYVYGKRYSISGALRADGSSKFAPGNQWGIFPSTAVSWIMSEEPWMKRLRKIDQVKIRYSFGTAGNNRIPAGQVRRRFKTTIDPRVYEMTNWVYPDTTMPNPELRWEKTLSHNFGIDMVFFKQRLSTTIELYNNTSKDLLVNYPMSGVGYKSQYRNIGTVRNRGIEGTLRVVAIEKKHFGLTLSANAAYNQNRVVSLGGLDEIQKEVRIQTSIGWDYLVTPGKPLGLIYGYKSDGWYKVEDFDMTINASTNKPVWTLKDGVVNSSEAVGSGIRPGAPKLKDMNGDGVVDSRDKVNLGCAKPDVTGGFSINANVYNFDLNAAFSFSVGAKLYNGDKIDLTQRGQSQRYKNLLKVCAPGSAWTNVDWETGEMIADPALLAETNANAKIWTQCTNSVFLSDYYIEDASFLRFNSLTIGYTIPQRYTQWIHISKFRVYATASNIFCLTNYTGYDPEVNCRRGDPLTPGVDYSAYPKSRGLVCGVNVTF